MTLIDRDRARRDAELRSAWTRRVLADARDMLATLTDPNAAAHRSELEDDLRTRKAT